MLKINADWVHASKVNIIKDYGDDVVAGERGGNVALYARDENMLMLLSGIALKPVDPIKTADRFYYGAA
jgi:hypothetical protein